nr:RNA-directed DNA polymerase [Tanacetum cinerariifolium]
MGARTEVFSEGFRFQLIPSSSSTLISPGIAVMPIISTSAGTRFARLSLEHSSYLSGSPTQSKSCEHDWKENTITNYTICYYCGILTTDMSRLNCPKCQLTTCALCTRNYLGKIVNDKGKQPHKPEEEKDLSSNEVNLLKELLKEKTEQVQKMIKDQAKEYYENKAIIQRREELLKEQKDEEIKRLKTQLQKEKEKETEARYSNEEFSPLGNSQIVRPFITTAIIDTGASACCKNKKVILEEAVEPLTQIVLFNSLNSRQQATQRIKQGSFLIEGNKFKIPLIYAFDMRDSNGIEMLIGSNFLRSMKGGIRIEGDEITIYQKVTIIKTSNQTEIVKIAELEVSKEELLKINESIYFNQEGRKAFLEQFKPVIERRNKAISSSCSLLSRGSPTVPLCLTKEYEDHLRRSHEDFQPLPVIFTKAIFTHKEPGELYRHYQLKANQTPIRKDKSNAWRIVAQDIEVSAAKEVVKAMRSLQAIIQCKAQICFGKSMICVKEIQEKDKIRTKPDKNEKRGEAGRSQKQLQ